MTHQTNQYSIIVDFLGSSCPVPPRFNILFRLLFSNAPQLGKCLLALEASRVRNCSFRHLLDYNLNTLLAVPTSAALEIGYFNSLGVFSDFIFTYLWMSHLSLYYYFFCSDFTFCRYSVPFCEIL